MISVIIPVYNVEPWLDQCLASVAAQTYTDWECILVDDGSTDGSGSICDRWAGKDSRFKVFHQANAGVSTARNRGIELAQGQWINFIDSDDWVDPQYLQALMDASSDGVQLVVSGHTQHHKGSSKTHVPPRDETIELTSTHTETFINNIGLIYGPCSKLFKNQIVSNMAHRFPGHISLGEDLHFCFSYLKHIKSIRFVPYSYYHYRRTESNSLSSKKRKDTFYLHYQSYRIRQQFLESRGMWNTASQPHFYKELWGTIYNGIFNDFPLSYHEIKQIVSIPEISELRCYQDVFQCAKWIKWSLIHRQAAALFVIKKILNS